MFWQPQKVCTLSAKSNIAMENTSFIDWLVV